MNNLKQKIKNTLRQYLNENQESKSTNNFDMFELLKTVSFIKYVDRPNGRFSHNIDLVIDDENNINQLKELLDKHNWYVERGTSKSYTISQKYVDDAKVEVPKYLYHITPSKNIDSIFKYGLKPKSEDLRHKYPPRIYVSDNIQSLKSLAIELKRWKGNEDYSIIKINTNNLDIQLYIDTTSAYKGHYYIQDINLIPSENLGLL